MDTNAFNTTALQDELTGALVGLARAADTAPAVSDATWQVMIEALAANSPAAACNEAEVLSLIDRVHPEKFKVVPDCATCAYSPAGGRPITTWPTSGTHRRTSAGLEKVLILLGVHGLAGYAAPRPGAGRAGRRGEPLFLPRHWPPSVRNSQPGVPADPTLLKTGEMVCKCGSLPAGQGQRRKPAAPPPRRASTTYAVTVHRINKLRPVYAEVPPRVEYTLPDLG